MNLFTPRPTGGPGIRRSWSAIAAVGLVIFSSLVPASAAEFNIADSDEAGLIAAIDAANANAEADVINLAGNSIYTLTTVEDMVGGAAGLPAITSAIVINGNGAVLRRSAGAVPPFRLIRVATTGDLTLNSLRLRNGLAPGGGSFAERSGGAILNAGTLTINRSIVEECSAGIGSGNGFGDVGGGGGGIYNLRRLTIDGSIFQSNKAGNGGFGLSFGGRGGDGGAIYNEEILVITNSTLNMNTSGAGGGSSMFPGSPGNGGGLLNVSDATITATTFSQNTSLGVGGGISNHGQILLTSCTIAQNTAGIGGGIFNNADLDVRDTILANQTSGLNCDGNEPPNSLGHNLDSDGTCTLGAAGDLSGENPKLGPLADNGGPTPTHSLLTGSPAIDAGDAGASATDQRGYRRPFDGNGDGMAVSDIGVVEFFDCDGNTVDDADPTDGDMDTIPDGCDQCPGADDKLDTDGDGMVDCLDPCPNDPANNTADENGNGVPDCQDAPSAGCCAPGVFPVMGLFVPMVLLGWKWTRRRSRVH